MLSNIESLNGPEFLKYCSYYPEIRINEVILYIVSKFHNEIYHIFLIRNSYVTIHNFTTIKKIFDSSKIELN